MANKINDSFVVNAGGCWTYLARVKNHSTGAGITQSIVSSIARTITNKATGEVTTTAITVSTSVFDTLQTNTDLWDETYNFKDDVAETLITSRVKYTLQYAFTLTSGRVIKTREVDLEGD